MNLIIALKLLSLSILSIFAIPGTAVFGSSDLGVFVTSSTGNVRLDMKATETREVADFTVKPESVVQIRQGENLNVFTVPPDRVDKVKITDSAGVRNELVPLGNNQYSLVGVNAGVYVLDVIVNPPDSSERAAYETILVILKPGEPAQNVQNIIQTIQKVKVVTEIDIDFDDDSDECSSKIGSAGLKFPQDDLTECDQREYNECKKNGFDRSNFCENKYEQFWDDDCFGFANAEECREGRNPSTPTHECGANETPIINEKGEAVCRDDIEASEDAKEKEKEESCIDIFPSICYPDHPGNDLVKIPPTPAPEPPLDTWGDKGLNVEEPETEEIEEVESEEVEEEVVEEEVEEETTEADESDGEGTDSGVN